MKPRYFFDIRINNQYPVMQKDCITIEELKGIDLNDFRIIYIFDGDVLYGCIGKTEIRLSISEQKIVINKDYKYCKSDEKEVIKIFENINTLVLFHV